MFISAFTVLKNACIYDFIIFVNTVTYNDSKNEGQMGLQSFGEATHPLPLVAPPI